MTWINPPATIRRFTWHQLAQHAAGTVLWVVLTATAALPGIAGPEWRGLHAAIGLLGAAFFAYHAFALVVVGVRHDVSPDKIAFLPSGLSPAGTYSREEKGDYLAVLAWSALLVATGIALRWPTRIGVPGPGVFAWLRLVHAGCGAALCVHVLFVHVPGRWLRAPEGLRRAIVSGSVPMAVAEARAGWVADLVAAGALVPVPEAPLSESHRESVQVRDLLDEGNALAQKGRYAEACAAIEEALRLFPDYSQARFNLAVARMRDGRADLAAEQFRLFIQSDPFNPMAGKAKELLGTVLGEKGEDRR